LYEPEIVCGGPDSTSVRRFYGVSVDPGTEPSAAHCGCTLIRLKPTTGSKTKPILPFKTAVDVHNCNVKNARWCAVEWVVGARGLNCAHITNDLPLAQRQPVGACNGLYLKKTKRMSFATRICAAVCRFLRYP
jgi:hypothetical protein